MSRNKFYTNVLPHKESIAWWKRNGATNEEIATKLGVSETSFKAYLARGRKGEEPYSTISTLLDQVNMDLTDTVEAALYKKTQGYNAKVKKHFKVKITEYDEKTGRKILEREELQECEDEVHVPADTQAQIFWLTRQSPKKWPFKPVDQMPEDRATGVIALPPLPMGKLEPPPEIKAQLDAALEGVSKDG